MAKRIQVILQDKTDHAVSRAAKLGGRSQYIDKAVRYYVATHGLETIREQLKQTALRDRDLSGAVAFDWFAVDHAPWPIVHRIQ